MTRPILDEPRAAYLHVPFCRHRCGYCDFTLVAGRDDLIAAYLRAMRIEIERLRQPHRVETLFFGGGTPTHLEPPALSELLSLAREWFKLSAEGEFSVEANPFALTDEKIRCLVDAGVNRISLGVQSFDDRLLALLERDHRADDIGSTVERLRQRFENISLDLIFALPDQSLEHWRNTLRRAIELQPTHISTYGLTFEKGTAFWGRREKGMIRPLPDELQRAMYAAAMGDLSDAGYEQYEISNFARPGFQCRHNQTYWRALPFFGFGPGAASYRNGRRATNHRSTTTWIQRVLSGQGGVAFEEELAPDARAREALILGIRQNEGVQRQAFCELTGFTIDELVSRELARHVDAGRIEDFGAGIRLTREGRFLADSIAVDFL